MNSLLLDVENQTTTGRPGKLHSQQHVNAGQGNGSKSSTRKALGDITNSRLNNTVGKSSNATFPRRQNVMVTANHMTQPSSAPQKLDDATEGATRWLEEPAFSDPVCESLLRNHRYIQEENRSSNDGQYILPAPSFEFERNINSEEKFCFEDDSDFKEQFEDLSFPELNLDN
mmetsp:Transcript_10372/g.23711  ORF Transcript_10372/g.23711 Transcript_10372/m.23711 type:complete len:172 (-) Transcript_10372:865-1380(-)|eukprot:767029-Hanusia_phi.AAC.1